MAKAPVEVQKKLNDLKEKTEEDLKRKQQEQEELEAEKTRKKKAVNALNYMKDVKEKESKEEKVKEEINQFFDALHEKLEKDDPLDFLDKKTKEQLPSLLDMAQLVAKTEEIYKKAKADFFKLDPETEKVVNDRLVKLHFEKGDFSTIAMCASNKFDKLIKHFAGRSEKNELAKLNEDKELSISETVRALENASNGKPKDIAKLLKKGFSKACKIFSKTSSKEEAAASSAFVSEAMHVMGKNPEIAKLVALNAKQQIIVKNVMDFNNIIKQGAEMVKLMSNLKQTRKFSPEEQKKINESISSIKYAEGGRQAVAKDWDEPVPVLSN